MPRFGTRSTVTYVLVGGLLAATFLGVAAEGRAVLDNAVMLALGFLFAKASTSTETP